jgi:trans-2,3-dihydro-3-hydroxyanthranilate isomerase
MRSYRFHQLDVFTDTPLAGNPLAVFPRAEGLDDREMQALAREMNLSETTFVVPSTAATRRVRFFTPAAEIPLAGHPTIGTWWLLAELQEVEAPANGTVHPTQETGAGVLPVTIRMADGVPIEVVMVQARPQFGEPVTDPATLARALGGQPSLIPGDPLPQVVSTALPQMMIPTVDLAALRSLPSGGTGSQLVEHLRSHGTDCAMCYTLETEDPEATVHCRMFAPGLGVPEDPATGSAAGALGAYLVRHGIVRPREGIAQVVVEQGIEIGRPSLIQVEIETADGSEIREVRVGGRAVTVIEGTVRL